MTVFYASSYAQSEYKTLKVTSITKNDDFYIIKGVEQNRDTLTLVTKKEEFKNKCDYRKIKINNEYRFELQSQPTYTENLVFRIGNKILWKTGDNPKNIPRYTENVNGIYIKK